MGLQLVPCPLCGDRLEVVFCEGCMGQGCVPVDTTDPDWRPEPVGNAEQVALYHAGEPSCACFLRTCYTCDKPIGYVAHYVPFPMCQDCEAEYADAF